MSTVKPSLTKETEVPQIPEPTPGNLLEVVRAIKEVLEVREGLTGDPLDQLLTVRDMYTMGSLKFSAVNRQIFARVPGYGLVFLPAAQNITPEYAPPPRATNLQASGALANVLLSWDLAAYHGHAFTEVWRAGADNFTQAVLIGTTESSLYADNVGATGSARFYWIRHVSQTAVPGPFNATAGTSATTGFIVAGDVTDGSITTQKIADGAVVTVKLGDASVVSTKLADSSVVTAKIGDSQVTTTKVGDSAITTVKIGDLAVDTAKIATGAVVEAKIGALAVTTTKLADGSITVEKHGTGLRPVQVVAALPALPDSLYPPDSSVVFLSTDRKLYRNSRGGAESIVESGTAQAGTSDTLTLAAGAPASLPTDAVLRLPTGPGSVQERPVSAYDGGTKVVTVSPRWRTNIVKRSEEFDDAAWSKINTSVTPNATASPDGATTAEKLINSSEQGDLQRRISIPDSADIYGADTYVYSVYAKAAEWNYVAISLYDGTYHRATFNLSTGAVSAILGILSADAEDVGNGWWRCHILATTTANLQLNTFVQGFWAFPIDTFAGAKEPGDGTSGIYIWGAQLEIADSVGDYIKTEDAAITLPDATTGYEVHSGAWTAAVPTVDLTGQITETQITDSAISTPKLAANAVTAAKIAAGTITANEIAANTVTAGEIAAATITSAQIAADTIVAGNIAAAAIGAAELAAASVVAGKIAANAIVAADGVIAAAAIETAQIQNAAITNAKIGNLAVDAAKIADATIVDAKIANLTITGAKIASATIGDAKITDLSGTKITAASITAGKLSVAQLAAIAADMGAITAGTITLNSTGHLKSGQTAYNTGLGFWLGIDAGDPKISIGDPANDYLRWDPDDGFKMRFKTFEIELASILSTVIANKWRVRTTPRNVNLLGIVWNGSIFCAVGYIFVNPIDDSVVFTSPDGVTWTERANPKNFQLRAVTWSAALGLFIAVGAPDGADAYLITSPTGTTWTERANPKNIALFGVAASATEVVAVGVADGTDAYIISSTNGTSWTERANPKNIALNAVSYSPELDLFVAVGSPDGADAYIVTSPDGVTWTERANPRVDYALRGITWSPDLGLFVAVGGIGNNPAGLNTYIITSPDGINWTAREAPKRKTLNAVVWNGSIFVACGDTDVGGADAYMLTSSNSIDWTEVETPQNKDLDAIAWSGKTFVAVGQQDATDPDGGSLTTHLVTSLVTV